MSEEVKAYFNKLLQSFGFRSNSIRPRVIELYKNIDVEGLMAIVITDRDGVPVFKVASEQTPELVLRHNFLATFGLAANQASKLGIGTNKSIICMYENHQVVQINQSPLLLTFIASSDTNTGLLLDMDTLLADILQDLKRVVAAS